MGVSLNGGTPNLHSFLVGKPMGLLGKPTILGKPPSAENHFTPPKVSQINKDSDKFIG